jgi:hypothetical protein
MPAIENNTAYAAKVLSMFDVEACEQLVLVITGTFDVRTGQPPAIADEQLEVFPIDQHRGDPASSSIRYPGHLAFAKPLTDILLTGHAHAPPGELAGSVHVRLRVADINKTLVVTGDRFWTRGAAGRVASAPQPFERLELIYERAFGGSRDEQPEEGTAAVFEPRNPIGLGLSGVLSRDPTVTTEVPNIEYPSDRQQQVQDQIAPASFGAVGPGWHPRIGFAGTYDAAWLKERAPLLPADFNPLFFQVAPQDQQSRTVQSGDLVEVIGMTPEGYWRFELPHMEIPTWLVHSDRLERAVPRVDTIHLDTDSYRVHMTARLAMAVRRNRAPLEQVILGEPSPGWLRARYAGKTYRPRKTQVL